MNLKNFFKFCLIHLKSTFWLFAGIWLSFSFSLAQAAEPVRLWVTGDLRGEIRPCGCSEEGDMGGLLRRATYLEQQRAKYPQGLYLDLGNNLPPPSPQGSLKAQLTQKAFQQLKPQAILLGPNELAYGFAVLDANLPYLVSNLKADWPVKKSLLVTIGKQRFSLWGYLSPEQIYQNKNEAQAVTPVSADLFKEWQAQFKATPADFRILLFRGNSEELGRFEQAKLFDLILPGTHNENELKQVLTLKSSTGKEFSMIPTKGQGILFASLTGAGKPVRLEIEWFRQSYADSPQVEPLFKAYDEEVKALFLSNLERMEQQQQATPYAGEAACKVCHLTQHEVWSKMGHAHAFSTLEKVGKHFDPECLACHVVGLNQHGFLSADLTPQLMNVQCENCHGPAKAHAANPSQVKTSQKPAAQACVTCHQGSHSPSFEFSKYWPKIQH